MAPLRPGLLVALLGVGACFHEPAGVTSAASGSDDASATADATTSPASTTSSSSTSTTTSTTASTTATTSSTSTTATTSSSTSTATTATGATDDTTVGPACPAAAGLGDSPACDACIAEACCDLAGACADTPSCADAWPCTRAKACIAAWTECPTFEAASDLHFTLLECIQGKCLDVCRVTPCDDLLAACLADPDCTAINVCVQAKCQEPCPPEDPFCFVPCWEACQRGHAPGVDPWNALTECIFAEC